MRKQRNLLRSRPILDRCFVRLDRLLHFRVDLAHAKWAQTMEFFEFTRQSSIFDCHRMSFCYLRLHDGGRLWN